MLAKGSGKGSIRPVERNHVPVQPEVQRTPSMFRSYRPPSM